MGVASATYSLVEDFEQPQNGEAMTLLALSHTPAEHQLYTAMHAEISRVGTRVASFTTRRLMSLTGINAYSSVRRGLVGLMTKLSIDRQKVAGDNGSRPPTVYLVFSPEEILARRRAVGMLAPPKEGENGYELGAMGRVLKRVVDLKSLSRREAQVAICCAQGLTNAEIGKRLQVSEQTVKFHLRNIFAKVGVRRRAELVSRLFRDGETSL